MKKKGFTLIELLAVIVILAILALIAIPIIISIINDSRENAHKNSIKSYGRNVENAITSYIEKNDVNETPKTLSSYSIKMSGSKVKCDDEFEYNDEELILTHCRVVDSKGKQKSKHTYTYKNRTLINEDEEVNQSFSIGQEITLNNELYYVINDGNNYVTALKAEPLTVSEVNRYGYGHINRYAYESVGEAFNWNGYGGIAYYSSETCGVKNGHYTYYGCTSDYDQSDVKYVVDAWANDKFQNDELKKVNGYKARLLDIDESIKNLNCETYNYTDYVCNDYASYQWLWNDNYPYWATGTVNNEKVSYEVYSNYNGINHYAHWNRNTAVWTHREGYGGITVRPVINIYKSAINN